MPKPRSKSKSRSSDVYDKSRTMIPTLDCTQKDLDAIEELRLEIAKLPTYKTLMERANDHYNIIPERRGRKGKTSPILRLILRAGNNLISRRIQSSESHLVTLRDPEYVKEMRCLMLEDLYAQHPESTLLLLHFTQHNPTDLDLIIDGYLLSEFLIKSNIDNFEELHRQIVTLWNVAIEACPADLAPAPFLNPYSDKIST